MTKSNDKFEKIPSTWNVCFALFRQVLFILLADKRVIVQVKCDPLTTRVITQRFLDEYLSKKLDITCRKTALTPRGLCLHQQRQCTLMWLNLR